MKLQVVEVVEVGEDGQRPIVKLVAGERSRAIDEAEGHLVERDPDLFQRGEFIVRVAPEEVDVGAGEKASALRIVPVLTEHMRERFNRVVYLQRYDQRRSKWINVDCPPDFANAFRERIGCWQLPVLRAVTTSPSLRPDGTIIDKPGYDRATGVYYDPRGVEFPAVPAAPGREEALGALDRLSCLFGTLDLVDDLARSVALSALLTPIYRAAMSAAPMHGITAPTAGSGKSKVVNLAAILATGHWAPVTALGRNEETEKRLAAVLLAGDAIGALDNAEQPIGGEFLCQVITEPLIAPRILGTSSRLVIPNTMCWYATGNNLKFIGDMVRRALLVRLDPHCERPELREFETPDPCRIALEERPALVVAALTIVRAFILAGRPRAVAPWGSFPDWSTWVRDPLIWLGLPDPVGSTSETRRDDPKLSALVAVLEQWSLAIGDRRVTAREAAGQAAQQVVSGFSYPEFREALLLVAAEAGQISARRLGRWLGEVKDRPVNAKRIVPAGTLHGLALWQLVTDPLQGGEGG